ncbi:MAG: 2-hydroxycyclohexane-1-carbonyl-CoA dehydrogenase [Pseudomonadota bacterium]|nr:SDR family oxidoreductase [Rubrivivax sp.]
MNGKVVIVTGAARGIGAAIAGRLAARGALSVIVDLALPAAQTVADEIVRSGGRALALAMDVSDRRQVDATMAEIAQRCGSIDILVNNAAINYATPIEDVSDEEWERIFAVNVRGVYNCCRAALGPMKARRWGRIVNISSSAGKTGGPISSVHYSASKAAVISMTKSFARHLADFGVTVNAVAPGAVETDMALLLSEDDRRRAAQAIPLHRLASPSEIAHSVAFLCSDEAAYITGEVLDVNGGAVMD